MPGSWKGYKTYTGGQSKVHEGIWSSWPNQRAPVGPQAVPAEAEIPSLGRLIGLHSWPLTCADAPGGGHRRLQDRGSHNGASAPLTEASVTPPWVPICGVAVYGGYRSGLSCHVHERSEQQPRWLLMYNVVYETDQYLSG